MGGRHYYDGVLLHALKGSLTTLLLPPYPHLGFGGTEPCLPSRDITPSVTRTAKFAFWRGNLQLGFPNALCIN
jgi:hypothetical protein